jgi:hypothetical protein
MTAESVAHTTAIGGEQQCPPQRASKLRANERAEAEARAEPGEMTALGELRNGLVEVWCSRFCDRTRTSPATAGPGSRGRH